jgi:hypothetical protein
MNVKQPLFKEGDLVHYDGSSRISVVVRRRGIWQYTVKDLYEGYVNTNVPQRLLKPGTHFTESDVACFKADLEQAKLVYEGALAMVERNKAKSENSDE